MNIYQKLKFYLALKRKNYRRAFITAFTNNKLTDGDKYFIILFFAMVLLCIALHFKEQIDSYQLGLHENIQKLSAQNAHNERMAHFNEQLVVSMLNGKIIVDKRLKTICTINAAGQCTDDL